MQVTGHDSALRLKERPNQSRWRSTLLEADPELDAPPSYLDSTSDAPPPYAEVDVKKLLDDIESIITTSFTRSTARSAPRPKTLVRYHDDLIKSMTTPLIDFDDTSNFRQAKKNKGGGGKAQKHDNKNSWGSDDEGKKDPGGGEGEGDAAAGDGGGNAAGGAGGDGGDGGGDDGGDDWNDWGAPSKKKKGKKGKGAVDEEEEKRKKEEEEKEKEQEDAAKANPLSWANPGNPSPDEEWGFNSTSKKGKKGKKDKVIHCFLGPWLSADILP